MTALRMTKFYYVQEWILGLLIFQRRLIGSVASGPAKKMLAMCLNVRHLLQSKYFLVNFHRKWMLFKNKFAKSLRKEHIEESNYH